MRGSSFHARISAYEKKQRKKLKTRLDNGILYTIIKQSITRMTYRIVDESGNNIDGLVGLSLDKAEAMLCRLLNYDVDAYLQDEQ